MSSPRELMPEQGWITTDKPRIPAPPVAEQGLMFRGVGKLSRLLGRSQVPDVFTVLQLHGRLFWGWLFFASRLMPFGRLPARTRELIILRTGWLCRCRYEWGQHVELALKVGVTDAEILAVAQGAEAFADPRDVAALRACDELCRSQSLSDETWALLSEQYSRKLCIEIMMLTGHYVMLAGFLNSVGIRLEVPIEAELTSFHDRITIPGD